MRQASSASKAKGTISLDLSASGASQRAIVSALNGNANLEFTDGAIRGVNIAKMIRNLGTGIVEGWQGGSDGEDRLRLVRRNLQQWRRKRDDPGPAFGRTARPHDGCRHG